MRDEHIISILESGPLAGLSEGELAALRAHADVCAECRRAYEAARVSSLLLRERAAQAFEPTPFFQTRVMAALRERRAAGEPWALRRMWRWAGALVSSMGATVAALAVLTLIAPGTQTTTPEVVSASDPYSAEQMFLAQDELPEDEMSYEHVLTTIYESEEDEAR